MRTWWATAWPVAAGVLAGLLAAAVLYLVGSQPRGAPVQLRPAPTLPPLVVHVSGAVVRPGIVNLPQGSRVNDAIQAAGGLLPEADPRGVNQAAVLEDGQMILVPALQALTTAPPAGENAPPAQRSGEIPLPAAPAFPININIATQAELETLPEIGPVMAQKIIEYRTTNGPFASIEAILEVSGIGPATFDQIKDLITVGISP